ncbi:cytochrome P450 [Cellulomonas sp. PhB143]|uniref:cytochrome P450 n=1 Tax=Cellulomonas sp. PhB143 TaxID=2485186 RepID=UPI000F47C33D|nr:cytochrome P450 [Cellulomonas sp. PhB143]ROS75491.1 fatty-acid peroxygenase [Cellulomonas sp. PhB143]
MPDTRIDSATRADARSDDPAAHEPIPRLPVVDSSLALAADGYRFVSRRADRLGVDAFRTRLLLRDVVCMRGPDAARLVYEGGRFDRSGSMPTSVKHLLQDDGSVQALEDVAHRHRKEGFVRLLQGGPEQDLALLLREELGTAVRRWRGTGDVRLHDVLPDVLGRVALRWAGIPVEGTGGRRAELWSMVEGAGAFGPANWVARARRRRTEAWARELLTGARTSGGTGTPLADVAAWTDDAGRPLPLEVAAVELLNLLRPIVAVALFVELAVLALLREPGARAELTSSSPPDDDAVRDFAAEVRRHAPFFPVIGARARKDVEWRGEVLAAGTWVVLDLYGTNHDARLWPHPTRFDPGRYARGQGDRRAIVAQGFGSYDDDHRCPGEPATARMVEEAVRVFLELDWEPVVGQDLSVPPGRMPARVADGVLIRLA